MGFSFFALKKHSFLREFMFLGENSRFCELMAILNVCSFPDIALLWNILVAKVVHVCVTLWWDLL